MAADRVPVADEAMESSLRERRNLIAAAAESAVDDMLLRIEAEPIRADLTVKQLLAALPSSARREFRTTLRGSRQIGGPRFPSASVSEVHLEADGREVLKTLVELARANDSRSPISSKELERSLYTWRNRTFQGTGGSATALVGPELRARPEQLPRAWALVSDEAWRSAYLQAHEKAVDQFIEAVRQVEIVEHVPRPEDPPAQSTDTGAGGAAEGVADVPPPRSNPLTLDKAFRAGSVEEEARQWLRGRPVRVRCGENRQVEVKLAVDESEWVQQLRQSISRPELGLPEVPEQNWERLEGQLEERLDGPDAAEIIGLAIAAETVERRPPLVLPNRPPEWTRVPISARGTAPLKPEELDLNKRRFQARQVARAAAIEELRQTVDALPVNETETVGDVAARDPAIRNMLDSSFEGLNITGTQYQETSITVEVAMNPRALWQALQRFATPVTATPPAP